jgi:Bacteriocin-protection, YdeI or OmpD-Associated/Domain of unknown function (DUF1905)
MSKHRFETIVELTGKTATFMEVPLDIPALFDGTKKPPVRVKIKDHVYRSTIAVYGGRYYLPINRDVKSATGVAAGDEITVEIERDAAKRVVDLPSDLERALKSDNAAGASFESMSYSHQKEYVDWIEEAKRAETRDRRIAKTVERLHAGQTP